jgi:hypothetical protein
VIGFLMKSGNVNLNSGSAVNPIYECSSGVPRSYGSQIDGYLHHPEEHIDLAIPCKEWFRS